MKGAFLLMFIACSACIGQVAPSMTDTLHWSASRKLTWADFQGKPIEGIPSFGEANCQNYATFDKPSAFSKTKTNVHAIFFKTISWIDPNQKSDQALLYFQVMFNLFEVHARLLRKELSETKLGFNPTKIFYELHAASMSRLTAEFGKFREETKGGSDHAALLKWNDGINERLSALNGF